MHERLLAIDYGRVRHGLAVSDGLGLTAHPLPALARTTPERDLAALRRLIDERDIRGIVVGLPLHMDGREGGMVVEVRRFGEALRGALQLPVSYEDERLSTDEAEFLLKDLGYSPSERKRRRDSIAAVVILRAVLDRVSLRDAAHASDSLDAPEDASGAGLPAGEPSADEDAPRPGDH